MALDLVRKPDALAEAMAEAAALVESQLDALLPVPEAAEARLVEAMRYAVLNGGKRLRAFLVMETAKLFTVNRTCAARVAAAVEMLHAYSLVHDDLPAMDDDDLRRGMPSCHKQFDEATAILAGDALQTRAFEVLAEEDTHADPEARCELVACLAYASGARGMAGGQMIDMLAEGKQLSGPEITRLQALKTGRLIQFSAEAGAILGRAPSLVARSRFMTTCWTRRPPPRKWAKPRARTPPPARRRWSRFWGWSARGRRPSTWRSRRRRIWRVLGTARSCCARWRGLR
jgi:farnesyl diphosphate synthase